MLVGREAFRFRYPRAVERGGSGRGYAAAEPNPTLGEARPHAGNDNYRLGARIRRQARRAAKRRSPYGRWDLTAQRGLKQRGHHAIDTEMRLAPKPSAVGICRGWSTAIQVECRGQGP